MSNGQSRRRRGLVASNRASTARLQDLRDKPVAGLNNPRHDPMAEAVVSKLKSTPPTERRDFEGGRPGDPSGHWRPYHRDRQPKKAG
jgi:hypothetical protein